LTCCNQNDHRVEEFLMSQTFKDNIYVELTHRHLISDGYQWKMFCKPNYERNAFVLSIYIAKQTKIEVDLEFAAINEIFTMPASDFELRNYVYGKVLKELDAARHNEDLYNQIIKNSKYGYHDDAVDAARYFYEIVNNIKEENKMAKTQNEIEFENFAKERQAQAEASLQAYKTKVENEIEAKRQEYLEADKKDSAYQAANQYRYFYDGLIAAGFNENQAMAILLEKCEVTRLNMKG